MLICVRSISVLHHFVQTHLTRSVTKMMKTMKIPNTKTTEAMLVISMGQSIKLGSSP